MKRIGFIAATLRRKEQEPLLAVRDFFWPSPLFRYSLTYCEATYDETFVLCKGVNRLLHLENDMQGVDFKTNIFNKREKKSWLRDISNEIRTFVQAGSEVYLHVPFWYLGLRDWLEPDYACFRPMAGKAIGQQLHFYKNILGTTLVNN